MTLERAECDEVLDAIATFLGRAALTDVQRQPYHAAFIGKDRDRFARAMGDWLRAARPGALYPSVADLEAAVRAVRVEAMQAEKRRTPRAPDVVADQRSWTGGGREVFKGVAWALETSNLRVRAERYLELHRRWPFAGFDDCARRATKRAEAEGETPRAPGNLHAAVFGGDVSQETPGEASLPAPRATGTGGPTRA